MKLISIKQRDNVFTIEKAPNLFEQLLGFSNTYEKYKDTGDVYHHFDHIRAYMKSNGDILQPTDEVVKILENFRRRF